MADPYSTQEEQLEDLLIDYFEAWRQPSAAAMNVIENTILEAGWMTQNEFQNDVVDKLDNFTGGPNDWQKAAADVASNTIETIVADDLHEAMAEQGKDDFWETGPGSEGLKLVEELEKSIKDAEARCATAKVGVDKATCDSLIAALNAELLQATEGEDLFTTPDGKHKINLAAIELGEVDKWEDTKAAYAARMRLAEQCILSSNLEELALFHRTMALPTGATKPYNKVHLLGGVPGDEGQARLIVNKLYARTDMEAFLDIKPHEMSQLVPKVEIWKTLYDKELAYIDEVRIPFPAHSLFNSESSVLESARSDYGVTAVNWKFHGSNPDLVRNDIEAWISFYFQGFDSLVAKHASTGLNGKPVEWSYMDLMGFGHGTLKREDITDENPALSLVRRGIQDETAYEIKVGLGYNIANSTFNGVEDPSRREKLVSAAKAQQISLYMNLIDHTIEVKDTGTIFIRCHYRGRLEAILSNPRADVLASPEHKTAVESATNFLEKEKEKFRKGKNEDEMKAAQENYNLMIDATNTSRLNTIMTKLEDKSQLYNIEVSPKDLGEFAANGMSSGFSLPSIEGGFDSDPYGDKLISNLTTGFGDPAATDLKERLQHVSPPETNQGNLRIFFFYFGDLIEALAEIAFSTSSLKSSDINKSVPKTSFSEERTKKMKIILGPFEYENVLCGEPKSINLASVPISSDRFMEFFAETVLASNKKTFPLMSFIRQLINELLIDSVGTSCFGQEKGHIMTINTLTIDAPASQDGEDPMDVLLEQQAAEIDDSAGILRIGYLDPISQNKTTGVLWNPQVHMDLLRTYSYLLIYTQQSNKAFLTGNPTTDKSNGIHHIYIGSSRGLLKQIQFQKTDMAYLREARFQTVSDNPYYSLSNRYNISVSMFGNNLFYPGAYLYLNPMGLGSELGDPSARSSISRAMGIGGYHLVSSVEHKIEGGSYSTSVTALWESSGGGRQFCEDHE